MFQIIKNAELPASKHGMHTTLAQFETIDGLLSAFLNRPEPDWASRASVTDWMRHEWRLYDACVDVLGLAAVQSFSSAADCAVDFVTRCMTSASLVEA